MSTERLARYSELARNFALKVEVDALTTEVDACTAEVVGVFGREGIEALVLKGPVLAKCLYPGEVRPYGDSDLMVAPESWARAVSVLERLGFVEDRPWVPTPLSVGMGGTEYGRGGRIVDLHCRLPGLAGDPDAIWGRFVARAERQMIGGVELRVPDRDTVLLHVVLHAAQHAHLGEGKPLEDLRRALARVGESEWASVLELARAYRGVPAFAAGLRLLPEGRDLARKLDLDEVLWLQYALQKEGVIAEQLYALLFADAGIRWKLAIAASRVFPRPDFMRWWSPLARRGELGLAFAYVWRVIWVIGQTLGAIHTLWRARRARGTA